jgi:2-dehydro-3-deoxy-D-arabinonate dehydratase
LIEGSFSLATWLGGHSGASAWLEGLDVGTEAPRTTLAPIDSEQEVWASGVTYLRSREARKAESEVADVYERVYDAPRPELFFKSQGWRAVGDGAAIGNRADSSWLVPEPELVLVLNQAGGIVGYCVGNDVSCRDIEGENPLYLPQAKIFDGSCVLGPGILIAQPEEMRELSIELTIERDGRTVFSGSTDTSRIKRPFEELTGYLTRHLRFPDGVLLMTGTGIVPPEDFCLRGADRVEIRIGDLVLSNPVSAP